MATITQTVQEYEPRTEIKQLIYPKTKLNPLPKIRQEPPQTLGCPADCPCKDKKDRSFGRPMQLLFNAIGIIIALIATYMIVTTDSNIYLIFWVCYSVLRRLTKSKAHAKSD